LVLDQQNNNLGTLTFTGSNVEAFGTFNLSVLFSLPSGFAANPVNVTGDVWGSGSYFTDAQNFAIVDFPNNALPITFSGPSGTGVFSLTLDDVCLSGGEPCSFSEIGKLRRSGKSVKALAFNGAQSGDGNVRWLKAKGSPSMFARNFLANNFRPNANSVTLTITGTITVVIPPTGNSECTFTQGYYQNHPDVIPEVIVTPDPNDVNPAFTLNLGSVSYTKSELLQIYSVPVKGNGLIALAQQLITAKLNAGAGPVPPEILTAILSADALIGSLVVPPIGDGFLAPSQTSPLVKILTSYNSGKIAGARRCR